MTTIEATAAEIGAISLVFGYPRDSDRFCFIEQCRARLLETGQRLAATGGLVGAQLQ